MTLAVLLLAGLARAADGVAEASASAPEGFNSSLAAGDLKGADAAIQALLDGGARTADVYYNLGNLRYREERYAEAILAWRCSEALAPRDPDVQSNLDVARRKLPGLATGRVVPERPGWAPWQAALTPAEGEWIGAFAAGIGLLVVAFGAARARIAGLAAVLLGVVVAVAGGVSASALPVGVALSPTKVTSDLGGGSELFTLPAGTELRVEGEGGGQFLVALPDARRGWASASTVALADPGAGCGAR